MTTRHTGFAPPHRPPHSVGREKGAAMSFIQAADGAQIYYKDWGAGPPVLLSHGWPLHSDSWEAQMLSWPPTVFG